MHVFLSVSVTTTVVSVDGDMFPITEKSAKIRGYVPGARLANRQREWVSILFPRAMWRLLFCCRGNVAKVLKKA